MSDKIDIENLMSLKIKELLQLDTIYQYMSSDVALNNVVPNQKFRFSDPLSFNDPFDCSVKLLKFTINPQKLDKNLTKLKSRVSRAEYRETKRRLLDKSHQEKLFKEKRRNYKLSCFSKKNDDILMWSHYAEKHTGICIGFDFKKFDADKYILCPVNYIDKIKEFDGNLRFEKVIYYWLTTKSSIWEYEEEIRAIKFSPSNETYEFADFPKNSIKEIIFGCNVSRKVIQKMIYLIKTHQINNIKLKQMKINDTNFKLEEIIINE